MYVRIIITNNQYTYTSYTRMAATNVNISLKDCSTGNVIFNTCAICENLHLLLVIREEKVHI